MPFVFSNYNPGELYQNILGTAQFERGLKENIIGRQMDQDRFAFAANEARRRDFAENAARNAASLIGQAQANREFGLKKWDALNRAAEEQEQGEWTKQFYEAQNQAAQKMDDLERAKFSFEKEYRTEIMPKLMEAEFKRRREEEDRELQAVDAQSQMMADSLNSRLEQWKKTSKITYKDKSPDELMQMFVDREMRQKGLGQRIGFDDQRGMFYPLRLSKKAPSDFNFSKSEALTPGVAQSEREARELGLVIPQTGTLQDMNRIMQWPVGGQVISPKGTLIPWTQQTKDAYIAMLDQAFRK